VTTVERMSGEAAVKLGGLDGPTIFTDASGDLIQANQAAVELLGAGWEGVAESLVCQAAARTPAENSHHCMLTFGAHDGSRRFAVHLSRDEDGCQLLLIDEEVSAPDLVPSGRLEEILESTSECFFALGAQGEIVYANSRTADFFGTAREVLLGRTLESFGPAEARFSEAYNKAMVEREATTYDTRLPGDDRWIEVHAYPAGDGMAVYFSDITDKVQAQEQLTFLAHHDALTRLPNRAYFQEQLKKAVARSNRGVPSALLFMDMDRFKIVNDTVGHAAGDEVLREFGRVVSELARTEDTFARFGGDEFALLVENTTIPEAQAVAARIQAAVQGHTFVADGRTFSLGVSIGLAPVFGTGSGGHAMALADSAMYEAKHRGGEQTCVMTETSDAPSHDEHQVM